MKQSLTRYIATINTELNKLSITCGTRTWRQCHFARNRRGSTQNITKVKCPMIFKRFFFFSLKKKKEDISFVMRLDGYQTIYHFAILEGM